MSTTDVRGPVADQGQPHLRRPAPRKTLTLIGLAIAVALLTVGLVFTFASKAGHKPVSGGGCQTVDATRLMNLGDTLSETAMAQAQDVCVNPAAIQSLYQADGFQLSIRELTKDGYTLNSINGEGISGSSTASTDFTAWAEARGGTVEMAAAGNANYLAVSFK